MPSIGIARTLSWLAAILGVLRIGIVLYAPINCPVDVSPLHPVGAGCASQAQLHDTVPFYGVVLGIVPLTILLGFILVGIVGGVALATRSEPLHTLGLLLTWLGTLALTLITWTSMLFGPFLVPAFVCAVLAALFATLRARRQRHLNGAQA